MLASQIAMFLGVLWSTPPVPWRSRVRIPSDPKKIEHFFPSSFFFLFLCTIYIKYIKIHTGYFIRECGKVINIAFQLWEGESFFTCTEKIIILTSLDIYKDFYIDLLPSIYSHRVWYEKKIKTLILEFHFAIGGYIKLCYEFFSSLEKRVKKDSREENAWKNIQHLIYKIRLLMQCWIRMQIW